MLLDSIKLALSITDTSKDNLLNLYIDKATLIIFNYLNDDSIDKEYIKNNFSLAINELVVSAYNKNKNLQNKGIKAITQGQRAITYSGDASALFTIDSDVADLLPKPKVKAR